MKYAGGVAVLVGALLVGGGSVFVATAQEDLFDCDDFATQVEALEQLEPGDPFGLDADSDGIPCEELPEGSVPPPVDENVVPPSDPELDEEFNEYQEGGAK